MRPSRKSKLAGWAAIALLTLLALAPVSVAAGPAEEEYVLDLAGVADSGTGGSNRGVSSFDVGIAEGIVGEDRSPETPLAATGSALLGPAGLAIGLALVALALFAFSRRSASRLR